ncbi:hypothetical protein NSTC745_07040 [Nostoc sp. DSM 114161]|jgi:hypothetical protein
MRSKGEIVVSLSSVSTSTHSIAHPLPSKNLETAFFKQLDSSASFATNYITCESCISLRQKTRPQLEKADSLLPTPYLHKQAQHAKPLAIS